MKKFIFFSLIAVMVAGMAFAQDSGITFSAWGRGVFSPLIVESAPKENGKIMKAQARDKDGKLVEDEKGKPVYSDKDEVSTVRAGSGITWGGPQARVGFSIYGNSDFVGFRIDFSGEDMSAGDNQNLWVKPFSNDLLKLTVGKVFVDNLRGKIATDTGFENFVVGGLGEDTIFSRFGENQPFGNAPHTFMLSSEPMEGLFIGAMVRGDIWSSYAANAYRYIQVGGGYNIEGIGHFRAQYIGGWMGTLNPTTSDFYEPAGKGKYWDGPSLADDKKDDKDKDMDDIMEEAFYGSPAESKYKLARIEAAFALTAIENLLVDIGFKFGLPFAIQDGTKMSNGITVALGASYNMGAFGIKGNVVASKMGAYMREWEDDVSYAGASLGVNLIPTFDLEVATVGLSLGMRINGIGVKDPEGKKYKDQDDKEIKTSTLQFGFGGFVQKGLGNGNVRLGLAYALAPLGPGFTDDDKYDGKKAYGSGVFSIPVILEYSF